MSKTYAEAYDDLNKIFTFQDCKGLEREITNLKHSLYLSKKAEFHLFILAFLSLLLWVINTAYYKNVERGLDDMILKMSLAIELMDNENYTKI